MPWHAAWINHIHCFKSVTSKIPQIPTPKLEKIRYYFFCLNSVSPAIQDRLHKPSSEEPLGFGYSYLPNTTPWVIIRTGVGFPSLGFYYCPWFSLFPTLGYFPALGFLFFPPLTTIQPLVLTSSHPWLLFSPWFSTFTHPWLRFLVILALFITYPTLVFALLSTLGYYSAIGFYFL